jgi:transcriptional regulator with XRE-family HTH domain
MLSVTRKEKNAATLGSHLRDRRNAVGYTQRELAAVLGLEYYTMISQIENGYISLPPTLWVPIADALKMDREEWVLTCLEEVQPAIYHALFGTNRIEDVALLLRAVSHNR